MAWLAARQYGVLSTTQLEACGLTRSAIRHCDRNGQLHRFGRGTYMVGHRATPPGARQAGGRAVVRTERRAEPRLSGGVVGMTDAEIGPMQVTVVARNAGPKPGVRVHRVTHCPQPRRFPGDMRW